MPVTKIELLERIFRQGIPLLDVRAPTEFAQGAFPNVTNLPILNDAEREKVGICYKNRGPDAAEALGYDLVGAELRQHRVSGWLRFLEQHPGAFLYCFRGGKRSQIAQQWIAAEGIEVTRIPGGYKAMRRYLLGVLDRLPPMIIVAGKTGVGKTELLGKINNSLDLEGHANHRGSAFGNRLTAQPSQINFENAIAIDTLRMNGTMTVEDEGRLIGRLNLPQVLQNAMTRAPIILLKDSLGHRVDRIFQEYIVDHMGALMANNVENPLALLREKYDTALFAIKKRLGEVAFNEITKLINHAFSQHAKGDPLKHKIWIERLLTNYYDPMYEYQINQKQERIVASGDREDLIQYLQVTQALQE